MGGLAERLVDICSDISDKIPQKGKKLNKSSYKETRFVNIHLDLDYTKLYNTEEP